MANLALGFGIIICIGTALTLKLTSDDSTVVDVIFALFMLIAVALALPMRFRGFIDTVGPFIPIIGRGTPAQRAVAATEEAVDASHRAADAVKAAVKDPPHEGD